MSARGSSTALLKSEKKLSMNEYLDNLKINNEVESTAY